MDFIEGLPKVCEKSVILMVVDCFSRYARFIVLSHRYSTASVSRAFFNTIVWLHGFPTSIISDRDSVFTSHMWREIFKLAGIQLCFSTVFHPSDRWPIGGHQQGDRHVPTLCDG